jgi:WD40 repeat protein/energy-coupling factor transporter ATP-binding protein EcfA2
MPETLDLKSSETLTKEAYLNPFPGLRPFTLNESHLFFGREGQSEEVINHLASKKFVAVIGSSGSGKSSLIFCGLVPVLYGGFINQAGSNWKIIITRPGNRPIANLSKSIVRAFYPESGKEQDIQDNITSALLRRSSMGIAEAIRAHSDISKESILLIADQFEELFRFKRSGKDDLSFNEAEAYVNLLVQAVRQSEVPIYMVLTMRSDFIGDCSQFQELTALINESNYLIPRMSRDDMKSAVTGPVSVGGAKIDPLLTQTLLNEIGDNPDQLPILQHSLMRTWDYWKTLGDFDRPLNLTDYDSIGRMEKALSEHANEAYDELDEEGKRICESLFKTLTEKGADNRGIRHPTRVEVIAEIAKTTPDKVIKVIDRFRAPGRSFLAPSFEIPLNAESVIDLSHESLMRIWNRLRTWVEEESNAVQMYQRLAEAAAMYQTGKTGLWRPPDLQLALSWRDKQNPTLTWAQRFNPAFERTLVFLETSDQEFKKEEEHKIRLQKRQLRRTRIFALVLGSAAIIALGLTIYSQFQRAEAIKQTNLATEQKQKADNNAREAQRQADIAKASNELAQKEKLIAEAQTDTAKQQKLYALAQQDSALRNMILAKKNEKIANQQSILALQNADSAKRQSIRAENEKSRATKLRMVSIAQSMSVKSLQIETDKDLKGLTALQAYQFNRSYNGPAHQADIYSGLYAAFKALNRPGFNILEGHDGDVKALTFVPNSSIVYSTGTDGKLIKWDLNDSSNRGQVLLQNPNLSNTALAISPDGKWLACGTDGAGIQLFNLAYMGFNPTPIVLIGHSGKIRSLIFAPDNQTLYSSGTNDNSIIKWDISSQANKQTISNAGRITKMDISTDGSTIAAGTLDGEILIFYTTQDYFKKVIRSDKSNPISCIAQSKNGKLLATGDKQGNISIWSVDSGKLIATLRGHLAKTIVSDVQFSPDNQLLGSVGTDGTVRLWDLSDFSNPPVVLKDHQGYCFSIAFSSDSHLFITGSSESPRLIYRPTSTEFMANSINDKLTRNMTKEEWKTYVASDIDYETTRKTTGSHKIGIK